MVATLEPIWHFVASHLSMLGQAPFNLHVPLITKLKSTDRSPLTAKFLEGIAEAVGSPPATEAMGSPVAVGRKYAC